MCRSYWLCVLTAICPSQQALFPGSYAATADWLRSVADPAGGRGAARRVGAVWPAGGYLPACLPALRAHTSAHHAAPRTRCLPECQAEHPVASCVRTPAQQQHHHAGLACHPPAVMPPRAPPTRPTHPTPRPPRPPAEDALYEAQRSLLAALDAHPDFRRLAGSVDVKARTKSLFSGRPGRGRAHCRSEAHSGWRRGACALHLHIAAGLATHKTNHMVSGQPLGCCCAACLSHPPAAPRPNPLSRSHEKTATAG